MIPADFNLREDVRHKHENNRHFYLRFDTTLRVFLQENNCIFGTIGGFSPWEPSYFRDNRWFFAVRAHRRSLADRPGGPLVYQHLLAGLCCIFTSTCLLDFAASSPAFAYWTFLHLKVSNWTVYLNCSQFLWLCSSIRLICMQSSQWIRQER